jgi:hypothetical protein
VSLTEGYARLRYELRYLPRILCQELDFARKF